jgi:hypothetical protein
MNQVDPGSMRKTLLFGSLFLTALSLVGSPGLTWTCLEGQTGFEGNGNCAPGRVSFTGSGLTNSVRVTVTRSSSGEVIDDYNYDSTGGSIQFVETLVPGDTYSVEVRGTNGLGVTRNITTGGGY